MSYQSQLAVAEAIAIIQEKMSQLSSERVPLLEAYGRILAEDVVSLVDHPSVDNSALDGYACLLEDTVAASEENPIYLDLQGEVAAGSSFKGEISEGQCVGIYTGAPVPKGATAVIRVEDTSKENNKIKIIATADASAIRKQGQDFKKGETKLTKGTRLNAASVGIAAATGQAFLKVSKKPRIAILATGDEVIEPGEKLELGQVYNANSYSVAGLIRSAGAEVIILPKVNDDLATLERVISELGEIDLLLTSGGVSMGKFDFVRDLLFEKGEVYFWKVAMRPAGPVLFGEWNKLSILGLPGNPVSSMLAFIILVKAAIQKMTGEISELPYFNREQVIADVPLKSAGFKETFVRLILSQTIDGQLHVSTTGNQNSGVLSSMLTADALAIIPPHTSYQVGDSLEVIRLESYLA